MSGETASDQRQQPSASASLAAPLAHAREASGAPGPLQLVARIALTAAIYAAGAAAARAVAISPEQAPPIWPAAGFALAALLVWGQRCWPGVVLGSLIDLLLFDKTTTGATVPALLGAGAALQAMAGAGATRRYFQSAAPLTRDTDVWRFLLLAGPVACLISPTVGVAALHLGGRLASADVAAQWLGRWSSESVGVLLFAPLALLYWPHLRPLRAHGALRVALPLVTTAVLLALGHAVFDRLERAQAQQVANDRMAQAYEIGVLPLTARIGTLQTMERLFAASGEVTANEFALFTSGMLAWPGLQAVHWIRRVRGAERPSFEATLQGTGAPTAQITERRGDALVRATDRNDYFASVYIEPRAGNEAGFGFDHGSIPQRRDALDAARDTAAPVATERITLLRTGRPGVFVFVPVYAPGFEAKLASVNERRSQLRGFVAGAFDVESLFATLGEAARAADVVFRLADITPGDSTTILATTMPGAMTAQWSRQIVLAGRLLRLEAALEDGERAHGASRQAQVGQAASVVAAFLVVLAALGSAGRNAATAIEVSLRTEELRRELDKRRAAERALRASEEQLAITLDSIGDAVLTTDNSGRITRMNPVAERLTGWRLHEARGRAVDDVFRIVHEETRQPAVVPVDTVLRTGNVQGLANHAVLIARDGSECAIADSAAPIRDADGAIRGVVLVFRDVSDERHGERALEASEARYRRLIEQSPYGMFVLCQGVFAYANPKALAVFGAKTEAELVGRSLLDFSHPDGRDVLLDRLRRIDDGGETVPPREFAWYRLDGTPFYGESTGVPYVHEGRRAALVLFQDITGRKLAEEQRDRFFELSPDLFCIADTRGHFKRVNPAFTQTLGWTEADVLERRFLEFVHPDDVASTLDEMRRHAAGQPTIRFENRYRDKGGAWHWLEWRAMPQRDGLVYATARDVTAQRDAARELEAAKAAAEAASRAKSAFLAAMSHEIRTPMNGVVGMVDVLARTPLNDQQTDMVRTVADSAVALLGIIDDILDFSKIEAGRMALERAPVCLVDLVESICQSLVPVADRHGVDVALFIAPGVPEWVAADTVRLRQVLYNVVGNAIKFSGGRADRRGRVSIRVDADEGAPLRVAFRVEDNGIGMTPETVHNLFQPFMQGEVSTTRRYGGTGLGLTISKRLVDLMGGELAVDSRPDVGSTFTITLPLEPAAPQLPAATMSLAGLDCVLVADNLPFDAADLATYLTAAGARVKVAADVDAVARIAAESAERVVVIQNLQDGAAALNSRTHALAGHRDFRLLLVGRSSPAVERVDASAATILAGSLLRRGALLRAVAVAAGRASPELTRAPLERRGGVDEPMPPSIADARASGRLILVAEDDAINQKVILRQLALLGYAAEVAANGVEALRMWEDGGYALLLTDLHMPEMDGYTLAERIRARRGARKPILALTANALRGEANRARIAGVDDYLTKPVSLAVLGAALDKWMPGEANGAAPSGADELEGRAPADAVDVSVLKRLVGDDDDTVRALLGDFLASSQEQWMPEVERAAAAQDDRRLGAVVHKIKSAARSIGALDLGDVCAELENACRIGDREASARCVRSLGPAMAHVEASIVAFLEREQA